jgi:hypothetical protein
MCSGQEKSVVLDPVTVGRPLDDATDAIEAAAASIQAFADKATAMLNDIQRASWWKLITGAKP